MSDFCDPVYYSPPGSFVHGIFRVRILEWVAISFSRGSSQLRDQTWSPALQADSLPTKPPGNPGHIDMYLKVKEETCNNFRERGCFWGKEGAGGEWIGEDYKGASLLRKYFISYPPVILWLLIINIYLVLFQSPSSLNPWNFLSNENKNGIFGLLMRWLGKHLRMGVGCQWSQSHE